MQLQNKSKKKKVLRSRILLGVSPSLWNCSWISELPELPPLSKAVLGTSLGLKILKFKGINALCVCSQLGANETPGIHFQVICPRAGTQWCVPVCSFPLCLFCWHNWTTLHYPKDIRALLYWFFLQITCRATVTIDLLSPWLSNQSEI